MRPVPKKRRMTAAPRQQIDPIDPKEAAVALTLANTYRFELNRYNNQRVGSAAEVRDPQPFEDNLAAFETPLSQIRHTGGSHSNRQTGLKARRDVWLRLARTLINARIPPEAFIRGQFAAPESAERVPRPDELLNPMSIDRYYQAIETMRVTVGTALSCAAQKNARLVHKMCQAPYSKTPEQAWAAVLEDLDAPLSALFRYCMACKILVREKLQDPQRLQDLVDVFKTVAVRQYIFAPEAYDHAWAKFLPPNFAAEAEAYYQTHIARQPPGDHPT